MHRGKIKSFFSTILFLFTFTLFISSTSAFAKNEQGKDDRNYLMGTASTGGTYYPVGVAISTLVKVKLEPTHKIAMSAISSGGSAENCKLLTDNEVQFAILQGLYGSYAWNGTGPFAKEGRKKNFRSVTMLWENVEHFTMLKKYAKTGTISDFKNIKGMGFSAGAKNSGSLKSSLLLLGNLGFNAEKNLNLVYAGYGASADALQNNKIAAMSTPAGVPAGAVTKAFANMGKEIQVLDFTDKQLKKADGGKNLWNRYVIPAGTYPDQKKDINTISQPNFLVVRDDVDEEVVYLITKTIYENLPFLNSIHSATKAMSLRKATSGLPIPLHPGALRYYKEAGIKIPAHLVVK